MKANDVVALAARNLRESVLRNSLTTVGISVGVASLVAMLSLGIGLQQLANRRLARSGLFNTVIVTGRDARGFGEEGRRRQQQEANKPSPPLDEDARAQIAKIPNVVEVYPDMRFMAEVSVAGGKAEFASVSGLPQSAHDRDAFDNLDGKYFSNTDASEAIMQGEFAKALTTDPKSLIGKELTIRYAERAAPGQGSAKQEGSGNDVDELIASGFSVTRRTKTLRIVGVTEQDPEAGLRFGRAAVFVPLHFAEELNVMLGSDLREMVRSTYEGRVYTALTARVDDPAQVQKVEDGIKNLNFQTFSLLDASRSLQRFFTILDLFLGIFGSLALAVALLGIVNTLIMAILERRREIGIMKAIGAADSDVRGLFFAEAGVMGLMGGIVGVLFGWGIGRVINFGTNVYLQRQQMATERFWAVPWWLVLGAITFSIVVSLISGMYPASRAAKLDPVQALRYE
ncbi:MAG: ABC transporter permease [Terriglobales bacterium]